MTWQAIAARPHLFEVLDHVRHRVAASSDVKEDREAVRVPQDFAVVEAVC
jgi:hypothetical protein